MSNILSYSDNITGSGWIARDTYSGDDIKKITDPNGGMVEYPRTAIPSPFAQVDLVADAFALLASTRLAGTKMHHRLVSDALDIAQLLFDYPNFAHKVKIVKWNPRRQIQEMEASGLDSHKLLAETLRMFMESDRHAYNFSADDDWHILSLDNMIIGATSPATFTMGAPVTQPVESIMIEEGVPLFAARTRNLHERDREFVLFLVHWFNAYPDMRLRLKNVYDYILVCIDYIRDTDPTFYREIQERVGNPHALERSVAAALADSLPQYYNDFSGHLMPAVLGVPLYTRRQASSIEVAAESDFCLVPEIPQPEGELLPLILRNGYKAPAYTPMTYVSRPWNDGTIVCADDTPISHRILPDTAIVYPWITDSDIFEDSLIELSTPIDNAHFFDGNITRRLRDENAPGYLLPLKPLFFKYFPADALTKNVAPGKKMMEMLCSESEVTAIVRIPIKKGYMELSRTYRRGAAADSDGKAPIAIDTHLSLAIFPFVRTGYGDAYNIRLFEMIPDFRTSLQFNATDNTIPVNAIRAPYVRTETKSMRSSYYEVDSAFDYIRTSIVSNDGRFTHSGVIIPKWNHYQAGSDQFTFAVDFGTTNSHVEYSTEGMPPRALSFDNEAEDTLVATLDRPGTLNQSDAMLDVEFIPRTIDNVTGFPLRTALASNSGTDVMPEVLRNCNIPFLYERKAFTGYKINTMLKWGKENDLSEQFLREIMLLIRARVILDRGDLRRTRIVYFYPVSMKRSMQNRYLTLWENLYTRYIDATDIRVEGYPESVAPAFFYDSSRRDGSNFVSIDIGGGSTDVVVYKADSEHLNSHLDIISSFRFAGNAIFGDGFDSARADDNPLIRQYAQYFSQLTRNNPSLRYIDNILESIMASKRSEDINVYLFSIENMALIQNLEEIDRRPYSYNSLLADDPARRLIFVYFYSAIIYYVACLMKSSGLDKPKEICFSGTASKILNIIGRRNVVEDYTRVLIERVYGTAYTTGFEIRLERSAPKQITCKGGLELSRRINAGTADRHTFSAREIAAHKRNFTLTDTDSFSYSSVRDKDERLKIEEAVKRFNTLFVSILDREMRDELGIPKEAVDIFRSNADLDIANYLAAGIKAFLPLDEDGDEEVEDVPFFYPITGIIRNTLLTALSAENITNHKE